MHDLPLLQKMFDQFHEAIYIVNRQRKILYYNPIAEKLSGFTKKDMEGSFCFQNKLNHINDEGKQLCIEGCPLVEAIENNQIADHFAYMHHKDGHRVRVHIRVIPHHNVEGEVDGAIEVFSDVSTTNLLLEEMKIREALAYIDSLTEVFNRHYLKNELPILIEKRPDVPYAVAFIDLDDFKYYNDTYGHHFGDLVLQEVAKTISKNISGSDVIVRYGGDEFVIVFIGLVETDLESVIKRLLVLLHSTIIRRDGIEVPIKVSLGATARKKDENIFTTIRRADEAMYSAKKAGKNCYFVK